MQNKLPTLSQTKQLHALIVTSSSQSLLPTIIASYASHQHLLSARTLFFQTQTRTRTHSVLLYNTVIRAHARTRNFSHASSLFARLRLESPPGPEPDSFTFATLLRACSDNSDPHSLRALHSLLLSSGFGSHPIPVTTLISSYSNLGLSHDALNLFDEMPHPDLVLYNATISALAPSAQWKNALALFRRMRLEGENPDGFSLVGLLSCFRDPESAMYTRGVHGFLLKSGFQSCSHVTSVLVSVYSRLDFPESSYRVFRGVSCPDLVTWSALIAGFSQAGKCNKALDLFREMNDRSTWKLDSVLVANIISACASLAAIGPGKEIHGYIFRTGLDSDIAVKSAIINLYSKCGFAEHGYRVFETTSNKNSVAYNSVISGLAANGLVWEALRVFDKMLENGCEPDKATFSGVLCACAHAGLLEEGMTLFRRMRHEFAIEAEIEHYVYVVKLMGSVGKLDEALELIESMPQLPGSLSGVWGALLWGCGLHGRRDLGEIAGRRLFEIDPEKGAYRVMLSNVYASEEKWLDVTSTRDGMMGGDIKKITGLSWIGDYKCSSHRNRALCPSLDSIYTHSNCGRLN